MFMLLTEVRFVIRGIIFTEIMEIIISDIKRDEPFGQMRCTELFKSAGVCYCYIEKTIY